MIEHVVCLLIIATGLTLIIVRSKITEPVRLWLMTKQDPNGLTLAYMVNCAQCTGVWVGLAVGLSVLPLIPQASWYEWAYYFPAIISMGTSFVTTVVDRYIFSQ